MYRSFEVCLKFRNKIYGGLPKSQEQVKAYVKAKFQSEDTAKTETDLDLDDELDKLTTQFRRDETGLYVGGYQIKAMLAESASLLGLTVSKRGSKNTVREGTVISGILEDKNTGGKVYFLPVRLEADGEDTIMGNVSTPLGNRSIMKSSEFVVDAEIHFVISMLMNRMNDNANSKQLSVSDVKNVLAHGRELGLGSNRRFNVGTFDVVSFKETETDMFTVDF